MPTKPGPVPQSLGLCPRSLGLCPQHFGPVSMPTDFGTMPTDLGPMPTDPLTKSKLIRTRGLGFGVLGFRVGYKTKIWVSGHDK